MPCITLNSFVKILDLMAPICYNKLLNIVSIRKFCKIYQKRNNKSLHRIEVKKLAEWNVIASNRNARFILGKTAEVNISRTYRKRLPHRGMCYINCGSVVPSNDDKNSLDKEAFVIGADPCTSYTGEVIAIAKTKDRKKEYWIVAPRGRAYYEPEIEFLVSEYIERKDIYFVCFYEKSCGAVLYTVKDGKRYYILIKNMSGHAGFPKGHVEFGENEKMTALREIYEETGVTTTLIEGFRETYNYLINGFVHKEAVYFTAPFEEKDIKMDIMEISEYKLVTFEEALKILNYPHDRSILRKANEFIDSYLGQK